MFIAYDLSSIVAKKGKGKKQPAQPAPKPSPSKPAPKKGGKKK